MAAIMSSPHIHDLHSTQQQQPQQAHVNNSPAPPPHHSTTASSDHSLPRSLSTPLHPSSHTTSTQLHPHNHSPHAHAAPPPSPPPDHSHSHPGHTPHTHAAHESSDQINKARAAVEESPDGKWARYAVKLGAGTFKDVWLAVDTDTGREVAWNAVDLRKVGSAKEQQRIRQETALLTTLRHPHIIEIYDVWENTARHTLCFITQKSSYTLKQHIANLHPAKIKVIKKYCRQILSALVYLHGLTPPIIHRDIKADNIFIDSTTGDIRIGDFGLSISSYQPTSIVGTPGFLSPEMFGESYNELVDIWSFGMCVLEMATNQYPYIEYNGSVAQLLRKGFEGAKPEALQNVNDPGMREFISMCLQPAEKRPSAKQLLEQKVFDLTPTTTVHQPHAHSADTAATNHNTTMTATATTAEKKVDEGVKNVDEHEPAMNSYPTPTKMSVTVTPRADPPPSQQPPSGAAAANTSSTSSALSVVLPQHAQTTPTPSNSLNGPAPSSPQMRAVVDSLTPPLISPASSPHAHVVSSGVNPTPASLGSSASSPALMNHAGALSPPMSGSTPPPSNTHSMAVSSKHIDPKRELLRVRAEALIPRVSVTKTTELSIVSIVLYVHFPSAKQLRQARKERKERQLVTGATDMSDVGDDDDEEDTRSLQHSPKQQDSADKSATSTSSSSGSNTPPQRTTGLVKDVTDTYTEQPNAASAAFSSSTASLTTSPVTTAQSALQAPVGTPPLSLLSSPVSSAELTPIHIASYDFSRDNYLAVATEITHHYPTFSLLEMDGVEELVAFRIEEATRERYNKWQAKARTTLNSEIMTLLTSLGISLNYALNFIEQEVSQEDLLYLSEEDLANFIPKLGPRRRLQQYIAEVKASRRLQEVEEEEEAVDSEEEREEERRRKRKAEKEGKVDKDKKDKKADKERERDKDSKAKKEQDKGRDKGDKDKEEKKERDKEKERGKEKDKAKRKEDEETETPRIKDRSLSTTAAKLPTKDKDKAERADKTDASKRGEKEKSSEEKKADKKKEKTKESDRQERPPEKKEKRREEEVVAATSATSGSSMLMDRVDRSLRERKLTVSRPPSALGTTSPSMPSSPRSARSDNGGEEQHKRKRSDSEMEFSNTTRLSTSSSSSVSSSNTTPEALKTQKRRVNSLTGAETVGGNNRAVRSGDKQPREKEKDVTLSAKERRNFIDDPNDNSSMHALLTKIGSELENKPKKTSADNKGPALTLHTAQLATGNSMGPQSGGYPASAFSVSTPIATGIAANGNLPLSRTASTPHTPTAVLQQLAGSLMPSPSPSGALSSSVLLSPSTSSTSNASSASRPSSRPSSPSSRRGSQPLLSLPSSLAFTPSTPPTLHTSHNGLSRPVSSSVSALPGAGLPSSSPSPSILLPPQHLSRLS